MWVAGRGTFHFQGYYNAEYMGGHAEYPSRVLTTVEIYTDKIVVEALGLEIPYLSMTNIENIDEQRMSGASSCRFGFRLHPPMVTRCQRNISYIYFKLSPPSPHVIGKLSSRISNFWCAG